MPQFEVFQDINSQEYTNFVPIPEYHDYYEEFPTVYWENTYDSPEDEERRNRDSSSDSSGSSASASSSAATLGAARGRLGIGGRSAGRSGGRGGRSSGGGSSSGHSSAVVSASAASIMAATFIALVAVSAFVLPTIDNADLSVDMDVDYGGDTLTYTVSLMNASANAKYYVVVMEGSTVVYEKEITGGYQTGIVEGLDGTKDHRVEIRTGLIPLKVVDSATIPGQSEPVMPVETYEFTAAENTIGYDVTVKSGGGAVTLGVYPAEGEAAVFTKVLAEGANTGTVPDLMFNHEYVVKLFGDEKTFIIKAVTTDRDTQTPSASAIDFTYGETKSVVVTGLEETPTMSYAVQSGSSVTVNESTGALTWVSAGEAVIRASFAETEHYKAGYIDVTVTTLKATQTAVNSTFTFIYKGNNQLSVDGVLDDAAVSYSVATADIVTVTEAGALTWVSAGEVAVTATIGETDRYLEKTVTITVTTEKAAQSPTASPVEVPYGDSTKSVIVTFEETPDTLSYAVQSGSSVTVNPNTGALTWASVGESTVRVSFDETEHYIADYIDVTVTALSAVTLTSIGLNDLCDVTWEGDVAGSWTLYVCDTASGRESIFASGSLTEGVGKSGVVSTTTGWNYGDRDSYKVYVNTPGLVNYSDVITNPMAEESITNIPAIRLHYEVSGNDVDVVVTINDTQYVRCALAKQYAMSSIGEFTPINGKATGSFTDLANGNYVVRYYNDYTDYELPDVITISV